MSAVKNTAVKSLYQAHHSWLYRLLNRKLNNSADAADLAQDAFVNLLNKPKNFNGEQGARNYLSRVVSGMCVDFWRRKKIEQAYLDALMQRDEPLEISPEQQQCLLETLFEVDKLLNQLPAKVTDIFILAQLEGLSYSKIAKQQKISLRTVNNYMAIALVKLAQLMDDVND